MTTGAPARLAAWAGSLVRTRSRGEGRVGATAYLAIIWFVPPAMLAAFVAMPMFSAQLGAIDDHEIAAYAGIPWFDAVSIRLIEPNRVRPVWWILHTAEMQVWGTWATGFYLDRLLLLLASIAGAMAVVLRFAPAWNAATAAFVALFGPEIDNWIRIGTQEAWAVPMLLWGLALLVRGRGSGVILVALAAWSKESMVPFAAGALVAGWLFHVDRRWLIAGGCAVGLAGIAVAWVAATGPALYDAQVRTPATIAAAAWWIVSSTLAPALAALGLAFLAGWRPPWPWFVLGAALIASQAVIYAGLEIPRYLAPASLVAGGLAAAVLIGLPRRSLTGVIGVVLVAAIVPTVLDMRNVATLRRDLSIAWQAGVAEVRSLVASHPDVRVVVALDRPTDLEFPWSLARYAPEIVIVPAAETCIGVGFDVPAPATCHWRVEIPGRRLP